MKNYKIAGNIFFWIPLIGILLYLLFQSNYYVNNKKDIDIALLIVTIITVIVLFVIAKIASLIKIINNWSDKHLSINYDK